RVSLFTQTILNVQDRFATLVISNLLYSISTLALTWLFIDLYGLMGVAIASFVANVIFGLVTLNLAMARVYNNWLTSLQLALRHTAAWGLTVGAFIGLAQLPDLLQRGQEVTAASVGIGVGAFLIQGVLYLAACLAAYQFMFRDQRIWAEIRSLVEYVISLVRGSSKGQTLVKKPEPHTFT
ncbi:MAG: hypothetical protein V3U90_00265, partial [Dehalococcoidia bacterium]